MGASEVYHELFPSLDGYVGDVEEVVKERPHCCIMHADDIVLCGDTKENLERRL